MKYTFSIEFPDSAHGAVFAVLAAMLKALPNSAKLTTQKVKTFVFHGGDDLVLAEPTPIEQWLAETKEETS
jgi:hypothetical protein